MLYKQIIMLAFCVLAIIVLFHNNDADSDQYGNPNDKSWNYPYSNWVQRFLLNPDITEQFGKLDIKDRKEDRYGSPYKLMEIMKSQIDTSSDKVNITLLPPNSFIKAQKIENFSLPEPAVFYYLSGLKTVWTTSPDVKKANWAIIAVGGKGLRFIKLKDSTELNQLLDLYKNYKPDL